MYIIVITHSSYAISYINVLNDLCICTKRLYTFLHNIMPRHITSPTPVENVASHFIHSSNQIKYKPKIYIISANKQIKLINKPQIYQPFLQTKCVSRKKNIHFLLSQVHFMQNNTFYAKSIWLQSNIKVAFT